MKLDLLIYCVGYEKRSAHIVSTIECEARIGIVFDNHQVLSFAENLKQASLRQDTLISTSNVGAEFSKVVAEQRNAIGNSNSSKRVIIGVDVSSMTRRLMAVVLSLLYASVDSKHFTLTILYSTGEYLSPPPEGASFIDFSPAPGCEGWTKFPERPLSVLLGLGYEADQAIGAIEYLDPSGIWAFIPIGRDPKFLADVKNANAALWPLLDHSHQMEYAIDEPYLAFSELRGLVASLSRRSRVVIVPGGPKLFSALSILAKFEVGDEVSIWRASTHEFNEPRDVAPSGPIVRFDYKKPRFNLNISDELAISAQLALP